MATNVWQVQIIVIPFGFGNFDYQIEQAIRRAHFANILVFCCPPPPVSYVGRGVRYPGTITIRSTDSNGDPSLFNPLPDSNSNNFATLGEHVESSHPRALLPATNRSYTVHRSGLSVATIVAASIAANLMFYTDHKVPGYRNFEDNLNLLQLLDSGRPDHTICYIEPWSLFRGNFDEERVVFELKNALRRGNEMIDKKY